MWPPPDVNAIPPTTFGAQQLAPVTAAGADPGEEQGGCPPIMATGTALIGKTAPVAIRRDPLRSAAAAAASSSKLHPHCLQLPCEKSHCQAVIGATAAAGMTVAITVTTALVSYAAFKSTPHFTDKELHAARMVCHCGHRDRCCRRQRGSFRTLLSRCCSTLLRAGRNARAPWGRAGWGGRGR